MSDLKTAAERLRRLEAGESLQDVYAELLPMAALWGGSIGSRCVDLRDRDRCKLGDAYLALVRPDDGETSDETWLRSVGFVTCENTRYIGSPLGRSDIQICVIVRAPLAGCVVLSNCEDPEFGIGKDLTRGEIRRLAAVLGITLKEKHDG